MEFSINEIVFIETENLNKKIVDCEVISNVEIYYMEDSTSYASHQLNRIDSHQKIIENVLSNKNDLLNRKKTLIAFENWVDNVEYNYGLYLKKNKKRFWFF